MSDEILDQVHEWLEYAERVDVGRNQNQLNLAAYHDIRENYQEVERVYRKFLDQVDIKGKGSRDEAIVLNNLAFILADKLGKHRGGLDMINRAIAILGPQADLLDTRAMVRLAAGEVEAAIEDLDMALSDYRPGRQQMIHFHMATAREKAGQPDEAVESLKRAFRDGLKADRLSNTDRAIYDRLKTKLDFDEEEDF